MGKTGEIMGAARRAGMLAGLLERCDSEDWQGLKELFDGEMARLAGEGKRYVALPEKVAGRTLAEGLLREYEEMGEKEKCGILRRFLQNR